MGEHLVHVVLRPTHELEHDLLEGDAQGSEVVLDGDRDGRGHRAGDQAVPLERAQRLGEHLLADSGQAPREPGVARRTVLREGRQDERDPLVRDPVEQPPAGALGQECVVLGLGAGALLGGGHGRHREPPRHTRRRLTHFRVPTSFRRVQPPSWTRHEHRNHPQEEGMSTHPSPFRAAGVRAPRGPESVELVDVPVREPAAGQVRVRIEAATVNVTDVWVTEGFFHSIGMIDQPEYAGLGWDFAGTVIEVGTGVVLPVGARVAGLVPGFDRDFGSYAEEIVAEEEWIAAVPDGVDAATAAALPLNALTAAPDPVLLGAPDHARLLVTGAVGVVGAFVVRLATARGWQVTGLA